MPDISRDAHSLINHHIPSLMDGFCVAVNLLWANKCDITGFMIELRFMFDDGVLLFHIVIS